MSKPPARVAPSNPIPSKVVATGSAPDEKAIERAIEREKWTHEDHLVNFRITWLLAIQTVLFGGYAYLLNMLSTQTEQASPEALKIAGKLIHLIPKFGALFAGVAMLGIVAALVAMGLMKFKGTGGKPLKFSISNVDVNMCTTFAGWLSAGLLPFVFAYAWLETPRSISVLTAPPKPSASASSSVSTPAATSVQASAPTLIVR